MRIKSVTAVLALLVVLSCLNSCAKTAYSVISTYDNGDCYLEYDTDKGCVRDHVPINDEIYEMYVNKDGAITSARLIESGYVFPIFEETQKGYPITTHGKNGRIESIEYHDLLFKFLYDGDDDSITAISYCTRNIYSFRGSDDESIKWDYDNMKTAHLRSSTEDTNITYTETSDSRFRLFNAGVWMLMLKVISKN